MGNEKGEVWESWDEFLELENGDLTETYVRETICN